MKYDTERIDKMRILIDTNILCLDMKHPKCMTAAQFLDNKDIIK